ncbi:LacI family DNA-binding transcriptional regulator [Nakamurella endophytica]|uniref:LacI family transcriptional regulator n=1 Tax=Nakamurella endophytica TaxID=1748367 RepID=A0A917SR98_9ACTN|nr:LacI family DNA-binding transcriptional regulator [Nakamurella endophytica]GGL95121.1 LacI family transcriptional regulator [Nakamurella endophytica]
MVPRRPSISDVAALAGVSLGTVSNVLNRPHVVAASTRSKVEAAISSLGFVRNETARQLSSGHNRAIGLVVLDIGNPFFTDVARGAQEVAQDRGAVVLMADSRADERTERANVELFTQQRVQGVLIAPSGGDTAWVADLRRAGTPFVVIDRVVSGVGEHCAVSVDDRTGGELAVAHLLQLGHRRIAFVGGPSTLAQVADRRVGAEAAVEREAGASLLALSTGALTVDEGRRAADTLAALGDGERPTAVFAANDLVALGVLQGCVRHGLRVPADLAIVGYDDIDFAAAAAVPLSSVRQPRQELGRTGTELLLAEIAAQRDGVEHVHRTERFTPELVARASTVGH